MSGAKAKRAAKIAGNVLAGTVLLLAVGLLAFSLIARASGRTVRLFGYSFHIVVTDSMTPEIAVGEFVVARSARVEDVRVGMDGGDNVVFIAQSGDKAGSAIIHRAVERTDAGIVTQGVKPGAGADSDPVTQENLVGIEVWHSAAAGAVARFFLSPLNWLFLIIIGAAVWIAVYSVKTLVKASGEKHNK